MTDATTGLPAGPERPTDATRAEPVAVVDDLTVTFATDNGAVDAVKGVSIDVRPGEVLALVGESGSGKSVTARSMLRLMPETATLGGAVYLDGTDVVSVGAQKLRELRGTAGAMVFQAPAPRSTPSSPSGGRSPRGSAPTVASRRRRPGRRRSTTSAASASPTRRSASTTTRTSSPAGRSSASSSRARWPSSRASSSPTSRPPRST